MRTEILASLVTDPVMMGEQELKVIKVRKYRRDQINATGTSASIIDKRMRGLYETIDDILMTALNLAMTGLCNSSHLI